MMLVLLLCALHIHSIHGEDRLILTSRSNPCDGRVDVYHDGKWGTVGPSGWTRNNSAVVCRSVGCGTVISNDSGYRDDWQKRDRVRADYIECDGTEENLWDCKFPGWDVIQSSAQHHVYVKCSETPKLSLVMNGQEGCAGFVRLSTKDQHHHLCADGWDAKLDSDRVCKELSYGTAIESRKKEKFTGKVGTIRPYKCLQDESFVWQCVDWTSSKPCDTPVFVTCSDHLHFRLKGDAKVNLCSGNLEVLDGSTWKSVSPEHYRDIKNKTQKWSPNDICAQVDCGGTGLASQGNESSLNVSLSCSEQVSISLKNNNGGKCYGVIDLNGWQTAVCPNSVKIGQLVCRELGCGEFMFKTSDENSISSRTQWKSRSCLNDAESLWHCHEAKEACAGGDKKAIICSESIAVRLRDGLDSCSGRAEIYYKGVWRRVSRDGWKSVHSDILCSHLQCGKSHKESRDLFVNGDSQPETLKLFVDGSCGPSDPIYKCLKEAPYSQPQQEFVKVICQGHQLFFVNGNSSCSGTVAVEQAEKTYALSGMKDAWNDNAAEYVCQRMQCGHKISWRNHTNHKGSEWMQLNCNNSNDTLESRCKLGPASTNTTVAAEVKCTGKVTVTLTNNDKAGKKCWGRVEVCRDKVCGGVCGDAWGDTHSSMLCESLGCGSHIKIQASAENMPTPRVTINSMHCPANVSDPSRCMFVPNNSSTACQKTPVHIICSGSLKSRLRGPHRDKCAGEVDAYLSGKWLPVCGALDKNLQKTVCAEMGCGTALTTALTSSEPREGLTVRCDTNVSIAKCEVQRSTAPSCQIYRVQCSDWRRLLVRGEKSACKGPVFVTTSTNTILPLSSSGWGARESKLLCSNVGCGELEISRNITTIKFEKWWNKTLSCDDGAHSIWDCEKEAPTVNKTQLDISCAERLTINLTNGCYGEVVVNGKERVCGSGWTDFMSHRLCHNLGCGKAVSSSSPNTGQKSGQLHHFSCTGSEVRLLQCASQKSTCDSKQAVSVICSGSLKFNLTEKCRGQIQVLHGGKWKVACMREKDFKTAGLLCEHFPGCGGFSGPGQTEKPVQGETLLSCDEAKSLEYCPTNGSCQRNDMTEINCGLQPVAAPPKTTPISLIVGVSVGLLLLLLAIVIALVLRSKKQRRRITDLLHGRHGFSTNTSTLARDDFVDLELRVSEERDVGLKNQANGQEKELDQASSDYDDVDEEAASLHTHREASEAPDPGGNTTDNPPPLPARGEELDNGVDYEEGYDDVGEPTAEEGTDHGVPSQSEDKELSVGIDAEDYVQPDAEE